MYKRQAYDRDECLELATRIEGHPDNVAPAIMGGLVSSFVEDDDTTSTRMDIADNLRFIAVADVYKRQSLKPPICGIRL